MPFKKRYLIPFIEEDLSEKMVFLGGPRQVGKTTIARELIASSFRSSYFTWDKLADRRKALNGEWPENADLIILDEFHKHSKWKQWIKGEFDTLQHKYKFLLTGSAHLNIYRRGGDSLQGRYHYYTLHPFSYSEINNCSPVTQPGGELAFNEKQHPSDVNMLLEYGGFPEPLFKQDKRFLRRWHNERMERFFKEDIRDLTRINDIGTLGMLADLLPDRAGSILSINSLVNELQLNFRTIANWLTVFEHFYYCFRVPPFQSRHVASVRKEKKLYLWDWSQVSDEGAKLENLVASHLHKFCLFMYECHGWHTDLYFLRDSTGREADFLVSFDKKPWFAVEVKKSDKTLSTGLGYFREKLKIPYCFQVVGDLKYDFVKNGVHVLPASKFLSAFI